MPWPSTTDGLVDIHSLMRWLLGRGDVLLQGAWEGGGGIAQCLLGLSNEVRGLAGERAPQHFDPRFVRLSLGRYPTCRRTRDANCGLDSDPRHPFRFSDTIEKLEFAEKNEDVFTFFFKLV